jgi:signal recognition particle receptor subunit beta
MSNHKIIFTGPVGAGKSTAIRSISDVMHIHTEELATDMTKKQKNTTTVALDYGVMNLPGDQNIHIYGTPGQQRFSFMWDILIKGGIGLVLLINNTGKDPIGDLKFFVTEFKTFIAETQLVIGICHIDQCKTPNINDFNQAFSEVSEKEGLTGPVPIFSVDASKKKDVATLVEALLFSLDTSLETTDSEVVT